MRKFIVFFSFLVLFLVQTPQKVLAAVSCSFGSGGSSGLGVEIPDYTDGTSHTVSFDMSNYDQEEKYVLYVGENSGGTLLGDIKSEPFTLGENKTFSNKNGVVTVQGSKVTWKITNKTALSPKPAGNKTNYVKIYENRPITGVWNYICTAGSFEVTHDPDPNVETDCEIYVWQEKNGKRCGASGCLVAGGVTTYIEAKNIKLNDQLLDKKKVIFEIGSNKLGDVVADKSVDIRNGAGKTDFPAQATGTHTVLIKSSSPNIQTLCPKVAFEINDTCGDLCSPVTNIYDSGDADQPLFELCNQVTEADQEKCLECIDKPGVWTAIGCIPTDPQGIIKTMVQLGLSIGGGLTLLLILVGAFRFSVSSGDSKQVEEAKEQITSAVIGLLFIIFSITLLRFIGVQFLQIPGFGGS
ncbi:MAG: hypothetical protein A2383_00330 [Candidatus Pacebacteria bacterium RIFOXYB1_FULL_39_46]|nr:MAG: hypothetical protein A2383_00330 [Candidatus Pacebacteria bacterium RIFOXYB1_FULL_39_46]OGJ39786.1 MAG: hypothetical protein A2582_00095 [Candidatus Pacebacteria bacterium RIFOXYD1_FULL_39_27]